MKKAIAIILVLVMTLSLASCTGGRRLFELLTGSNYDGPSYSIPKKFGDVLSPWIPVLYVNSMEEEAEEHVFLCIAPDEKGDVLGYYRVVTVKEDADGVMSVTEVQTSGAKAYALPGEKDKETGWFTSDGFMTFNDVDELFGFVTSGLEAKYDREALVAVRFEDVADYAFFYRITSLAGDAQPKYVMAVVTLDAEGMPHLTEHYVFAVAEPVGAE